MDVIGCAHRIAYYYFKTTADGCVLVGLDFKTLKHLRQKEERKTKYQYWDKIAAAFKSLLFLFRVFLLNIHGDPLSSS